MRSRSPLAVCLSSSARAAKPEYPQPQKWLCALRYESVPAAVMIELVSPDGASSGCCDPAAASSAWVVFHSSGVSIFAKRVCAFSLVAPGSKRMSKRARSGPSGTALWVMS